MQKKNSNGYGRSNGGGDGGCDVGGGGSDSDGGNRNEQGPYINWFSRGAFGPHRFSLGVIASHCCC